MSPQVRAVGVAHPRRYSGGVIGRAHRCDQAASREPRQRLTDRIGARPGFVPPTPASRHKPTGIRTGPRPDRGRAERARTVLAAKCAHAGVNVPDADSIRTSPYAQEIEREWENMLGHQPSRGLLDHSRCLY
jgi:hypothetical protein